MVPGDTNATASTVLPQGQYCDSQRKLLGLLLHNPEGMAVEDLVPPLQVTVSAVRQHLAVLERDGMLVRQSVVSGRGRPRHYYALSAAGREAFPRRYDALAMSMMAELAEQLGEAELPGAMQRMGRRTAAQLGGAGALSVAQLADALQQLGYAAHRQVQADGAEAVVAMNCVFHRLAQQHSAVCEFDLELMRTATGLQVEHQQCMAGGGACCRFRFSNDQE